MTNYNVNKGIGKTVEFEGLKIQYLFIFAGGLLGTYPGHFNWRGYLKSQDSLSLYSGYQTYININLHNNSTLKRLYRM